MFGNQAAESGSRSVGKDLLRFYIHRGGFFFLNTNAGLVLRDKLGYGVRSANIKCLVLTFMGLASLTTVLGRPREATRSIMLLLDMGCWNPERTLALGSISCIVLTNCAAPIYKELISSDNRVS